jgi:hypothetical protein
VNLSADVDALVPSAVVTNTPCDAVACAGDTAVISVFDTNTRLFAATVPDTTFVAPSKAVPVTVTDVPPPPPDGSRACGVVAR